MPPSRKSHRKGRAVRHTRSRRSFRQRNIHRGGGAMPMSYFTGEFDNQLVNDTGSDYNYATADVARPALMQSGGTRRNKRHRSTGGFYPSVMGPFIANASRIAVPLAAVAASHYLGAPAYFGKGSKGTSTRKVRRNGRKSRGRRHHGRR